MQMSDSPANKRPRLEEEEKILVVIKHNDSWGDESMHMFWSTEEDPKKIRSLFYQAAADRKTEFVPITLHSVGLSGPLTHTGKTVCLAIDDDEDGAEDTSSDDE
jgi:hypothetical protein